jgi:hypothetical protein
MGQLKSRDGPTNLPKAGKQSPSQFLRVSSLSNVPLRTPIWRTFICEYADEAERLGDGTDIFISIRVPTKLIGVDVLVDVAEKNDVTSSEYAHLDEIIDSNSLAARYQGFPRYTRSAEEACLAVHL